MRIFVSYSAEDSSIARIVLSALEDEKGVQVVSKDDAQIRGEVAGNLRELLAASDLSIALWSENYFASRWTLHKLSELQSIGETKGARYILPALIADTDIPAEYAKHRFVDLRGLEDNPERINDLTRQLFGDKTPAKGAPRAKPAKNPRKASKIEKPPADAVKSRSWKESWAEPLSKMSSKELGEFAVAYTGGGGSAPARETLEREAETSVGAKPPMTSATAQRSFDRAMTIAEYELDQGNVAAAAQSASEAERYWEQIDPSKRKLTTRLPKALQRIREIQQLDAEATQTAEPGNERRKPAPGDAATPNPRETAPYHRDQAATEDLLHRKSVANALGRIIDRVWEEDVSGDDDKSFVIHLHGPWGSGKSSILNFLREKLESGDVAPPQGTDDHLDPPPRPPWLVVNYNAWRAQGRGPAWWSMMEAVYEATQDDLAKTDWRASRGIWLHHWLWRLKSGWIPALITFAVTLIAVGLVFLFDPENFGEELKVGVTLAGLLASLFALQSGASFINTEKARQFVKLSRDPIRPLSRRYEALVEETRRPVAVFVDDLDRCDAEFVVEVLQSIQTLYRNARVAYVVAGDRDWICRSFEMSYADFGETVATTGRTLGHNFLEKIFQLSVEVPPITEKQRERFWSLLLDAGEEDERDVAEIKARVKERFDRVKSDAEIEFALEEFQSSALEAGVAGDEAINVSNSERIRAQREHFLSAYARYLEPNPRSMKRLLNAYGFRRGFDLQSLQRTSPDALARWTIFEMRWPLLAEMARRGEIGEALTKNAEARDVLAGLTRADLPHVFGQRDGEAPSASPPASQSS
ncbi:MAG: P-loop NTPase fold protein [Pseudomonadota bacterium]